ncbi:MAG TPA: phage holin family protein [Gammaproteobacteria bacterium]|nr:phage holin family protein [Gammaproteobacteria bacterium]
MASSADSYESTDIPKDVAAHFIRQKTNEEKARLDAETPPRMQIKEIFSSVLPEVKSSTLDPLYRAEWQLTLAEFQFLMRTHGDKIATIETLKPFKEFLANRWKRINGKTKKERIEEEKAKEAKIAEIELEDKHSEEKTPKIKLAEKKSIPQVDIGTDLIYSSAPDHPSTLLCKNVANKISEETTRQRLYNIFSEKTNGTGKFKKLLANKNIPHFYRMDMPLSEKELISSNIREIHLYKNSSNKVFIKSSNETGFEVNGYLYLNLEKHDAVPVSLLNKQFTQPYKHPIQSSLTPEERTRVMTRLFEQGFYKDKEKSQDALVLKNEEKNNIPQINSVLMPTVSLHYYPAIGDKKEEHIDLDKISLDHLVLTDNGEHPIPVRETMKRAARQVLETGEIEFKVAIGGCTRKLTESEKQRLLSHSPAVAEYYQAIEKCAAQVRKQKKIQEESKTPISIGQILQNFLDGKYGPMTLIDLGLYFRTTLPREKRNELYALKAYCAHLNREGTFEEVIDFFWKSEQRNKAVQATNLRSFLSRHKLTFPVWKNEKLKAVPPAIELSEVNHEALLAEATGKFEAAMQAPVTVNPGYGEAGRQRLVNQLYDVTTFPHVIEVMDDVQQLADYLQAMPSEKLPAFITLLSDEKLKLLFTSFDKDNIQLTRIWHLLDDTRKNVLRACVHSNKLNSIENNQIQYDENNFTIIAEAMRDTNKLADYLRTLFGKNLEDFVRTLSDEKIESIFNAGTLDDVKLSRIWFHLDDRQKIALASVIKNAEKFQVILNSQITTRKNSDYDIARTHFSGMIQGDETASVLLNRIDKVRHIIPSSKLSILTEFVYRSAIRFQNPDNEINNQRYPGIVKQVVDAPWGKIMEGALCFIVGAGLIATAGMLAASTMGASTPLSAAAIWLGAELVTASVAALTVGGAITLGYGVNRLADGVVSHRLSKASCRFFAKQEKEEYNALVETVVRHSINSVHEEEKPFKSMGRSLLGSKTK